mmetsp:Transcript_22214/g.71040  ORF Transcript_22214/g.71040 Transcript_22214/m.71040 type:complete len:219 (-) Transcript_22214:1273-1929(-)
MRSRRLETKPSASASHPTRSGWKEAFSATMTRPASSSIVCSTSASPSAGDLRSGVRSPCSAARWISVVATSAASRGAVSIASGCVEWTASRNLRGSVERIWPKQSGTTRYDAVWPSCSRVSVRCTFCCRQRSAYATMEYEPSNCRLSTAIPKSTSVATASTPRETCGSWWRTTSTSERAYASSVTACPALKTEPSQPASRASSMSGASRQTQSSAKRR